MHISLLPEPDILFICKVEEVTEQLMETTARQFENLKKENDHQVWLKEQYATLCASPKTSIEQIVPSINDSQKTAPVINIPASSSDSLSTCSSPVKIPVQLTESLTSLRDFTPLDSKDGSESSEGSVSAPLPEQIKPKEEESSDADSNSCTLRNQDMTLLEINGKLCNSVEESESSDDSGSCLAVNKPADSAVQMVHTPEFSDCGDTPALSNNIIEFSDNEETVPVSSELMDFSDREEIPAITKNVMDFSESLKISSVSKQTVEISDNEESQQSETKQPVIRNDSLLLELDTVAASTTDPDLLSLATVYPVSSSTVTEEQIFDLPVSDLDVKPATPMSPAVSLKLKTPENQQSENEAQVLKDVIFPTKTKDLNLNLVFEDLMISTVLSVLLQETIINSKARAEHLGNSVKVISEETPVLFISKEQPFNVNRVEDQLPANNGGRAPAWASVQDHLSLPSSSGGASYTAAQAGELQHLARLEEGGGKEGEAAVSTAPPSESPPPSRPPQLTSAHPRPGNGQCPARTAPPSTRLLLPRRLTPLRHAGTSWQSAALAGRAAGNAPCRPRSRGHGDHLMPRPPAHTPPSSGPGRRIPSCRAARLLREAPTPPGQPLCLRAGRQAAPLVNYFSAVTGVIQRHGHWSTPDPTPGPAAAPTPAAPLDSVAAQRHPRADSRACGQGAPSRQHPVGY
ncbi:hypothetical protein NDU88_002358 [Pleurodeles waltl]|uniref:Uncharacterized protein n=1 Tax=Pleurodeles waltl TaxID=8319 RepID=A0AAV7NF88_PLEWA|nr:hypothetical protein NDU88_002358 [Pleurodeles waltl]